MVLGGFPVEEASGLGAIYFAGSVCG